MIARDAGVCQLRLAGCRLHATTADHIIPVVHRPDLELDPGNLRASCRPCNLKRGTAPALPAAGPLPSPRWVSA